MRSLIASILVASALLSTACVGPAPETSGTTGEQQEAGSIGTFTSGAAGFDTHSFYLDTGKEVVVFDAQFTPELAKELIAEIRSKTSSPIKYVVVTHPNPDKFNGASELQKIGAEVVASKATAAAIPAVHAYKKHYFVNIAKMFTEESYPAEPKVDITFEGDFDLPLEAGEVKLHQLAASGVSSTQTVAWVPAQKALFVGDLVHHGAHAWLEGGVVDGEVKPDLASWKQALGELSDYEDATVFGGRGESADLEHAVEEQIVYLETMEELVTDYVAGLGDAKSELSTDEAGEHYKKITIEGKPVTGIRFYKSSRMDIWFASEELAEKVALVLHPEDIDGEHHCWTVIPKHPNYLKCPLCGKLRRNGAKTVEALLFAQYRLQVKPSGYCVLPKEYRTPENEEITRRRYQFWHGN